MSDDYTVGYGKPPKHGQFKPGNKAAAGKRRKKDKPGLSIATALAEAIATPVTVQRGDQRVTMAAGDVLTQRLVRIMTTGNARELGLVISLIEKHLPQSLSAPQQRLEVVYTQSSGSTVALPPAELWHSGEQS